jgi:hypothetical protein
MPYSLEHRLRLMAQVSNLMLAGSMHAYSKNANDNRTKSERRFNDAA